MDRLRARKTSRSVHNTRLRKWAPRLVILALIALALDLIYVTYSIGSTMPEVADGLRDAKAALGSGDLEKATDLLHNARDKAERAADLTSHPSFLLLSPIPDVHLVDAVADSAKLAAEAGLVGVSAARGLGASAGESAAAFFSGGQLHTNVIARVRPLIGKVANLLEEAAVLIEEPSTPFLTRLEELRAEAQGEIEDARDSAQAAQLVLSALPGIFGEDGDRRYVLAFQALGEARATGGLIGFYGILSASDGRLRLTRTGPITDPFPRPLREPVDAPDWFEESYGPQSAQIEPAQTNSSPNFPVVAEVLLDMFTRAGEGRLDGMIMMDPVALSDMMRATEPITVAGSNKAIDSENVEEVLMHDSYLVLESGSQQNAFLSKVVEKFWGYIAEGDFEPEVLADGLAQAIKSQHVRIYMRDEQDDNAMEAAGAAGDYTAFDPNVQIAFHNNYSANKVDYYTRRSIDSRIELLDGGDARITTEVTIENEAPDGPPSLLLGPFKKFRPNDPPGMNHMLFNVLLPNKSKVLSFDKGKGPQEVREFRDDEHPVAWDIVNVPPGKKAVIRIRYLVDGAYEPADDGTTFSFTAFPQPSVVPDSVRLTVAAPEGFELTETNAEGEVTVSTTYEQEGVLDGPVTIELDILPVNS